jgi:hypothetical protein
LDADDEWERYIAVTGAARQREVGALDAVVAVLERGAAACGGDRMTMSGFLRPALDLAAIVGPAEVRRVRERARQLCAPMPRRPSPLDLGLEEMLADA